MRWVLLLQSQVDIVVLCSVSSYVCFMSMLCHYCFHRMLQTDMQLSGIYLVSELAAAMLKIHCYIVLGAMHSCGMMYFVHFYRTVFYPLLEIGCQHCTVWSRTDGRSTCTHTVNKPLLISASFSRLVVYGNMSWTTGWPTLTSCNYTYTELVTADSLVCWQSTLMASEFGEAFHVWSDMRYAPRICGQSPSVISITNSKCRELHWLRLPIAHQQLDGRLAKQTVRVRLTIVSCFRVHLMYILLML